MKNFDNEENSLKYYHGKGNQGYNMKEHKKVHQMSKVTLHFVGATYHQENKQWHKRRE